MLLGELFFNTFVACCKNALVSETEPDPELWREPDIRIQLRTPPKLHRPGIR